MNFVDTVPSLRALPQPPQLHSAPLDVCGWFDSSFDLAQGLEVAEQDDETLYQLWALSR